MGTGEDLRCSIASYDAEKKDVTGGVLLSLRLVLLRLSVDWIVPIQTGEGNLLSPLIQMLISPRNTLIDTCRNNI